MPGLSSPTRISLLAVILLAACSQGTPSPDDCRFLGVAVPDGSAITGTIVNENIASVKQVQARCQSPFEAKLGCTLSVGEGEYVIWSVNDPKIVDHERCHALYEVWTH